MINQHLESYRAGISISVKRRGIHGSLTPTADVRTQVARSILICAVKTSQRPHDVAMCQTKL